jgi:hypothetical protein
MTRAPLEETVPMTHSTAIPRERHGRRRRIVALVGIALVAGLLGIGAIPQSGADALPPLPPVPPTDPTSPPTLPPTTGTAPPTPPWVVNTLLLNQDTKPGSSPLGAIAADRYWLTSPIITQGEKTAAAAVVPGGPGTIFDPVPAGSANLAANGTFNFPAMNMPAGSTMVLRVREAGVPGSLCRTNPVAPLPPSGQYLHLLVAPPVATDAAGLNAMAAGVVGIVQNTPPGVVAIVTTATITPQANALSLHIQGLLRITIFGVTYNLIFDYTIPLTISPVNGVYPNQVLTAQAVDAGTLNLGFFGPAPSNGPAVLAALKSPVQAQLKTSVVATAGPKVNDSVLASHDVKWWLEQGFTLSIRKVAYSTSALTVYGALCRLN